MSCAQPDLQCAEPNLTLSKVAFGFCIHSDIARLEQNRVHMTIMEKQVTSNQNCLPNERCYAQFCFSEQGQEMPFGTWGFWKTYGSRLLFSHFRNYHVRLLKPVLPREISFLWEISHSYLWLTPKLRLHSHLVLPWYLAFCFGYSKYFLARKVTALLTPFQHNFCQVEQWDSSKQVSLVLRALLYSEKYGSGFY